MGANVEAMDRHQPARHVRRPRRSAQITVALLAASLVVVGACAVPPDPPPQWLAAGCYQHTSEMMSQVDLLYSGTPDRRGNLELRGHWVGHIWNSSVDGSCSGPDVFLGTLVRASSSDAAAQRCRDLGHLSDEPPMSMTGFAYPMPSDAWACALTEDELL